MPFSEKQRRLFFADLSRAKKGQRTVTGMSKAKLHEHAHAPLKKKKKRTISQMKRAVARNRGVISSR